MEVEEMSFDEQVLSVLHDVDWKTGSMLMEDMEREFGKEVSIGKLYTTLDRLIYRGFAEDKFDRKGVSRVGRPRRYFRLTRDGNYFIRNRLLIKAVAVTVPA